MRDEIDLTAALDLAGGPALVLRRAEAGRPAPVVAYANPAFAGLAGTTPGALAGRGLRTLRGTVGPSAVLDELARAAAAGEPLELGGVELGAPGVGGSAAVFGLRGRRLERRPDLYLAMLARSDGAPADEPARAARGLAGLTRECPYQLAVEADCRLRLAWADPRLAELTGHTAAELAELGGFFALVVEADRGDLRRRNQRLLAGQPGIVRYRLRRKDGRIHRVRDTARPELAADGRTVTRIVGTLADLSADADEALATPALGRAVGLVAAALDAFVCFLDPADGRVRWAGGRDLGDLSARLRGGVGQALAGLLPAAALDVWLDWLGEAAAKPEAVRFVLDEPDVDGVGSGNGAEAAGRLDIAMTALAPDLVQVVVTRRRPGRADVAPGILPGPDVGAVLDGLPEPLLLVADPGWRIAAGNAAFERLVGRPRGDLAGASVLDRLPAASARAALAEALARASSGREPVSLPNMACQARGGERALDLRLTPVPADGGGSVGGALLVEAQRASGLPAPAEPGGGEAWLNAILESVADGIVTLDAAGTITWLSRSAETIFDYPRDAAVGGSIALLLASGNGGEAAGEAGAGGLPGWLSGLLAAEGADRTEARAGPLELVARRRSGELIPIEAEATALDHAGRRVVILTVRDITVRRQTEETLKSLAYHDPLTGLPNRLLFHDRLSRAIEQARRNRQLLPVMLVDLDRFKLINDSLGLEKGDQVLKAVGDRLSAALRKSDTVARLGGDEFMVLPLGTRGAEAAARVAQKLLECLKPALRVNGHELTTAASIGIALFPHDGDDADTLVKNADTALGRAKQQGRNHYQFYTEDMNATAFERLMLETALRKALGQGELLLHYQPKVSLEDGSVVGVEALLRWSHPDLGLVPPSDFIPLAEETGLIVPIGEWVLRTACAEVRRWHRAGFERIGLAVNLSARQFQDRDLAGVIRGIVEETGLPPASLELELTESVIMRDPAETARRLRELTGLGIRCSVDDFGTGYSSLAYLKTFPIAALKIDRSFVRDLDKDPNSATIAEAILALAAKLGLGVVAEGVEGRAQLEFLRRHGCQQIQGYLFARPLPAEECLALLREGRRLEL